MQETCLVLFGVFVSCLHLYKISGRIVGIYEKGHYTNRYICICFYGVFRTRVRRCGQGVWQAV